MSFFDDELDEVDAPSNTPNNTPRPEPRKKSAAKPVGAKSTTTTRKRASPSTAAAATTTSGNKRSRTDAQARPAGASAMTPSQLSELTPDARAMARMQIASEHQYGRQWNVLLQWVQLGKIQQQYLVNSTIADSAIALARSGKY